ncbi:hypothetical protein HPT25_17375 [Bacillus sp. BRMEA1]|uniref:hypothetical protein n=1 Tax=Neobacillus endophyticus TaxID=2738405 RepID=UPI0015633107|nr:hypothetical protein [Neobacillus endophyticus]NRD79132.1 hypothetical protein [Neobacillus endophyticus]
MLVGVLILSIFISIVEIKKCISLISDFHWFELISVTLFVLCLNSFSFNFYSSGFPSFELSEILLQYIIVNVHFEFMYPLLFIFVLTQYKRNKLRIVRYGWTLLWFIGYLLLLLLDHYLGVLQLGRFYMFAMVAASFYIVINIFASIYFMGKFRKILAREGIILE